MRGAALGNKQHQHDTLFGRQKVKGLVGGGGGGALGNKQHQHDKLFGRQRVKGLVGGGGGGV